ncbi:MAG: DMT family transporter [Myxococcota bacterium]|nr:DMT family transporter [Myxococcota bacterium]
MALENIQYRVSPSVWVALGATCISGAGPLVKAASTGPSTTGFYRTAFAALLLFAFGIFGPGKFSRTAQSHKAMWLAIIAGFIFGIDLFAFHHAIVLTGAGLATLLTNTQVFWVALFASIFFKEALSPLFAFATFGALGGVALLTVPGIATDSLSTVGTLAGLATGLCYATYILTLRESQTTKYPLPLTINLGFVSTITSLVLFTLAILTGEETTIPHWQDFSVFACLAIIVHIGGWVFISLGITRLSVARSALLILLQPVLTMIWGVLFFDEPFGKFEFGGTMLTLSAIYLASITTKPKTGLSQKATATG